MERVHNVSKGFIKWLAHNKILKFDCIHQCLLREIDRYRLYSGAVPIRNKKGVKHNISGLWNQLTDVSHMDEPTCGLSVRSCQCIASYWLGRLRSGLCESKKGIAAFRGLQWCLWMQFSTKFRTLYLPRKFGCSSLLVGKTSEGVISTYFEKLNKILKKSRNFIEFSVR